MQAFLSDAVDFFTFPKPSATLFYSPVYTTPSTVRDEASQVEKEGRAGARVMDEEEAEEADSGDEEATMRPVSSRFRHSFAEELHSPTRKRLVRTATPASARPTPPCVICARTRIAPRD